MYDDMIDFGGGCRAFFVLCVYVVSRLFLPPISRLNCVSFMTDDFVVSNINLYQQIPKPHFHIHLKARRG